MSTNTYSSYLESAIERLLNLQSLLFHKLECGRIDLHALFEARGKPIQRKPVTNETEIKDGIECLFELTTQAHVLSSARLPSLIRAERNIASRYLKHPNHHVRDGAKTLSQAINNEVKARVRRAAA